MQSYRKDYLGGETQSSFLKQCFCEAQSYSFLGPNNNRPRDRSIANFELTIFEYLLHHRFIFSFCVCVCGLSIFAVA